MSLVYTISQQLVYNVPMHILKTVFTSIFALLLHITLPVVVLASVFTLLLAVPGPIKRSLAEAEVYQAFTETVAEELTGQAENDDSLAVPPAEIREAVDQAIATEPLQEQVEQALDATYDWLNGLTQRPEFTIDLSQSRENFANSVSAYAADRLESLPTCSSLSQLENEVNPLTAECLPPRFDRQTAIEAYSQELLDSGEFLPEVKFSSSEIFSNFEDDTLASAPSTFQQLKQAVWIVATVSGVLALAIFLLAPTKRIGLRRVGLNLAIVGLWLGLFAALSWIFQDTLFSIGSGAASLQIAVIDAVGLLVDQALTIVAVGAGVYLLVGLVLRFALARLFHEKDTVAENSVASSHPNKK